MILIREEIAKVNTISEGEKEDYIQKWKSWVNDLSESGNYHSGKPLEYNGRYITESKVFSDGPFIEGKEAVTGYFMIKAEDHEQAVALVRGCPVFKFGGALEIRPIMIY